MAGIPLKCLLLWVWASLLIDINALHHVAALGIRGCRSLRGFRGFRGVRGFGSLGGFRRLRFTDLDSFFGGSGFKVSWYSALRVLHDSLPCQLRGNVCVQAT